MLGELVNIFIAAVLCWLLFIVVDVAFGLPEKGGVSGADAIASSVDRAGGDLNGGSMMGNIVCSPDASAGTLLAACGVYAAGVGGGLTAAVLVFIGNRICHDPGYAGTTGAVLATFMVYGLGMAGITAAECIAGMVIAILTIQGISHVQASRLLGKFWGWRT
ncbi:MAG TPA: hypothetical protein ENN44_00920 [Methanoculleus sp.]|nr:hypothetical protein [Methanoculleus sp.]